MPEFFSKGVLYDSSSKSITVPLHLFTQRAFHMRLSNSDIYNTLFGLKIVEEETQIVQEYKEKQHAQFLYCLDSLLQF